MVKIRYECHINRLKVEMKADMAIQNAKVVKEVNAARKLSRGFAFSIARKEK